MAAALAAAMVSALFIDISPLKKYRDFRLLFIGQLVSFLGSMITFVVIPYQIYELTQSNWMVGLLGAVQLVPVLLFGLIGGSVADSADRRSLLINSELFMMVCALGLMMNSFQTAPNIPLIFLLTALMQAANGFHRPAMEAHTQKLVASSDYPAVAALTSFRSSFGHIVGPSIGGLLMAYFGAAASYAADALTFLVAIVSVSLMTRVPPIGKKEKLGWAHIQDGLRFAISRPQIIGTYIVDIVAMAFAFPVALFPSMSQDWGGAQAAGLMFSAMSMGSLIITLLSGWTSKVQRHGAAVVTAAALWGLAIIALGFSQSLPMALACLALAGAADMVSGLFRGVIWNESVPNSMRGRLSGLEMISYMSGPLIGNFRAGWVASWTSPAFSIWTGGMICVAAVLICAKLLPDLWRYKSALLKSEV